MDAKVHASWTTVAIIFSGRRGTNEQGTDANIQTQLGDSWATEKNPLGPVYEAGTSLYLMERFTSCAS